MSVVVIVGGVMHVLYVMVQKFVVHVEDEELLLLVIIIIRVCVLQVFVKHAVGREFVWSVTPNIQDLYLQGMLFIHLMDI